MHSSVMNNVLCGQVKNLLSSTFDKCKATRKRLEWPRTNRAPGPIRSSNLISLPLGFPDLVV